MYHHNKKGLSYKQMSLALSHSLDHLGEDGKCNIKWCGWTQQQATLLGQSHVITIPLSQLAISAYCCDKASNTSSTIKLLS